MDMLGEVWISNDLMNMQEIVRTTNGAHVPLDDLAIDGVLPSMTFLTSMSANEFDRYYREVQFARAGETIPDLTETFPGYTTGTTNAPLPPWHEILMTDTTHNISNNDPITTINTHTIPAFEWSDSIRIHNPIIEAVERSSGFDRDDIRDIIIEVLKSKGILDEDGEYYPQQVNISEDFLLNFITGESDRRV